jgi:succinate-semialdehyde dehydrogenase/glutarate-semialdehyde dehydrogenase
MSETTQPRYQAVDPTTGEVQYSRDFVSDQDLETALSVGHSAFMSWRAQSVEDRATAVKRVAREFERRASQLAEIAVREMGKPLAEAMEEIEFCVAIFDYYADHGPRLMADQPIETTDGDRAFVQKVPIGLLLGVMPWNFPYYQVARFAAPNLVAGNTVLLKHAESVPGCALAIKELTEGAGLPSGIYQNVFASHAQTERVIGDPRVQGVSLTGSERAGAAVASTAGHHLKKCVLELGGSDPYIVLDTADVRAAAKQAWQTRLYNTGQACNSNKRIIVMGDFYDSFVAELTKLAKAMRPGDPMELRDGDYAPLSSRAAAESLAGLVEDAVAKGARLHAGGELMHGSTAYYSPAVLTGVTPTMRAYREELFGPVAVVYRVESQEEAVQLANDSDYGLGGAVFSRDQALARKIANQLEVGMANVNTPAGEGAEIPFGGVKRSGFGRELGPLGMDEFVNKRLLYVKEDSTSTTL